MVLKIVGFVSYVALGLLALMLCNCSSSPVTSADQTTTALLPAVLLPSEDAVARQTIRFLERIIQQDPEDFIAHNKLAGLYLQRVRETGDITYLKLASHAAHSSLATLPPEQNAGGVTALAQVEFTSHDFVAARDHARKLTELEPGKSYPYQILGDALLELGEYDKATGAFWQMERLGGIQVLTRVAIEQRKARLAALRGDTVTAERSLSSALGLAVAMLVPPRETVAWCRWQLGETAFSIGDYVSAEQHYRDALVTFPDYFRALSSLGRVRAARGDLPGAIEQYERVVRILPDPAFVAALGDLYKLVGRDKEATAQYELVEQIAKLNAAGGSLYDRQLALFYADHDIKPKEAYAFAKKEYALRRDIYGADTLAWTALKSGKIAEAQDAMKEALKLKTRDARLFYHAGMIARAAGEEISARGYFELALRLNPQFDPLQARVAKIMANRGIS